MKYIFAKWGKVTSAEVHVHFSILIIFLRNKSKSPISGLVPRWIEGRLLPGLMSSKLKTKYNKNSVTVHSYVIYDFPQYV